MSEPSERVGAVPQPGRPVTVLVSSAGRRVELLRGFRRALASLGVDGRVIATDATWYSSAFHEADEGILVPRLDDPAFVPTLLEMCEKHGVDLLVPTIDTEMAAWVGSRDQFAAIGTTILLSGGGVVDIAADKQLTHDWLVANGFPTVGQATPEAVLADPAAWTFPLVAKPRFGSAGIGVAIVRDADELAAAVRRPELGEMVVQTLAGRREYTIDVLADRDGRTGASSACYESKSVTAAEIAAKLRADLPDAEVALEDLTGTSDHWKLRIVSAAFAGQSLMRAPPRDQRRARRGAGGAEGPIHALTMDVLTSDEVR